MPATEDHIERAREAVRTFSAKKNYLDALLASNPTRWQTLEFTESVRVEGFADQLEQRIKVICKAAGIDGPIGAERLLAMQIGLQQDQNTILQNNMIRSLNQKRAEPKNDQSSGTLPRSLALS